MNDSHCPHCKADVTQIKMKSVPAYNFSGKQFHGVVFLCPDCDYVLGAGLDPVAIATDAVDRVVARLQK